MRRRCVRRGDGIGSERVRRLDNQPPTHASDPQRASEISAGELELTADSGHVEVRGDGVDAPRRIDTEAERRLHGELPTGCGVRSQWTSHRSGLLDLHEDAIALGGEGDGFEVMVRERSQHAGPELGGRRSSTHGAGRICTTPDPDIVSDELGHALDVMRVVRLEEAPDDMNVRIHTHLALLQQVRMFAK